MDTASKVGPLLASEVDSVRLPHAVPLVPAPKVEAIGEAAEEAVDKAEDKDEDEVLAGLGADDVELGVELDMAPVDAVEEAKILGQKVLENDWISVQKRVSC